MKEASICALNILLESIALLFLSLSSLPGLLSPLCLFASSNHPVNFSLSITKSSRILSLTFSGHVQIFVAALACRVHHSSIKDCIHGRLSFLQITPGEGGSREQEGKEAGDSSAPGWALAFPTSVGLELDTATCWQEMELVTVHSGFSEG